MTFSRKAGFAAAAVAGLVLLSACGSDAGTSSSSAAGGQIAGADCASGSIKASGSTAQLNAMTEWINGYQTACTGATVDYQGVGSGAGITDFINGQTAFAGSDSAIQGDDQTNADKRCSTGSAINIPMVGGAIVAAYNVSGVSKLTLTPEIMAGIWSNKITKWNDPKLVAANPGVTLPDATIAQFHRSDSSGTTDNWTKFLDATAPSVWTYGHAKDWSAPGGQGSKGNDGVGASLASTPNSIGYVELSFAQEKKLNTAAIDNGAGPVDGTSENAAKTLAAAQVTGSGNNIVLNIDYKSTAGYPAVLVTYEITCEKGLSSDALPLTKAFLTYTASDEAQAKLTDAGYVPITGDLLTKVRTAISAIS
ncbi:MAG: phosphate ABC transporter substrate-binding protein PstS [Frankiales bacterium]|nr:phosphate ABC transporter substrate-binding protein PstS [Frankiales bacterium]